MTDMHGRDKQAISVLEHTDGQSISENFGCFLEISEHCVTPPICFMSRAMALTERSNHVMMSASVNLMYMSMAWAMVWIAAMIFLLWN